MQELLTPKAGYTIVKDFFGKSLEIPEDWSLSSLMDFVDDKVDIVAGPFGSNLKVSDYRIHGVPIIRLQNIERNRFINENIKYISPEKAEELKYHSYRPNDIVLAKLGDPIGKTCIIPDNVKSGIVVADVVRIRPSNKKTDTKFLEYALNSNFCSKQMNGSYIGTTRPRVNLDQIRYLKLYRPPLIEQQKIASILSKVDELIQKTDQIIEQTKRLKIGLMQQLLTKGIGHTKFKTTTIGKIPEDWQLVSLEGICTQITDGVHKTPNYKEHGIPFISVNNIAEGKIDLTGCKYISYKEHEELIKRCLPEKGDLLLGKVGTLGVSAIVESEFDFSIFVQIALLKPNKNKTTTQYLKYTLDSTRLQGEINKKASGTTIKYIGIKSIGTLTIPLPPLKEQVEIADILMNIENHVSFESDHKYRLTRLKRGLMQELLTGRIRVKV